MSTSDTYVAANLPQEPANDGALLSIDHDVWAGFPTPPILNSADDVLVISGGSWPLSADLIRIGHDLILTGPDGTRVMVRDYYSTNPPPTLKTESGQVISPDTAAKLSGEVQYAKAAPAQMTDGEDAPEEKESKGKGKDKNKEKDKGKNEDKDNEKSKDDNEENPEGQSSTDEDAGPLERVAFN